MIANIPLIIYMSGILEAMKVFFVSVLWGLLWWNIIIGAANSRREKKPVHKDVIKRNIINQLLQEYDIANAEDNQVHVVNVFPSQLEDVKKLSECVASI